MALLTKHERKYILNNHSFNNGGSAIWPSFNLLGKKNVVAEFIGRNFHRPDRGKTKNTYVFAVEDGEIKVFAVIAFPQGEPVFTEGFDQIK